MAERRKKERERERERGREKSLNHSSLEAFLIAITNHG